MAVEKLLKQAEFHRDRRCEAESGWELQEPLVGMPDFPRGCHWSTGSWWPGGKRTDWREARLRPWAEEGGLVEDTA